MTQKSERTWRLYWDNSRNGWRQRGEWPIYLQDIIVKDITALNISDNEPFATVSAFTRQTDPIIVSYAEYHIVFIYKLFYTLHVYFPANKDIYKNVLFLANS